MFESEFTIVTKEAYNRWLRGDCLLATCDIDFYNIQKGQMIRVETMLDTMFHEGKVGLSREGILEELLRDGLLCSRDYFEFIKENEFELFEAHFTSRADGEIVIFGYYGGIK